MSDDSPFPDRPGPEEAGSPPRRAAPESPPLQALIATAGTAVLVSAEGEVSELAAPDAAHRLAQGGILLSHTAFTTRRLNIAPPPPSPALFDVMELWAFVRPAVFCVPSPKGLARALALPLPDDAVDAALVLFQAARALLHDLTRADYPYRDGARAIALALKQAGWAWGRDVVEALDQGAHAGAAEHGPPAAPSPLPNGFDVWHALPEWEDSAPPGPPGTRPVSAAAARARLAEILNRTMPAARAEKRSAQSDYAACVTEALAPRSEAGHPHVVLAEAGTGIGKTLGYLAAASLWAEENGPGLWISTYTKNLQRQIDQELTRLYPDPAVKADRTMLRKGRENYLCLLNFQEKMRSRPPLESGLIARWIRFSRDGDMVGGDFPSWLMPLFHLHRQGKGAARPARGTAATHPSDLTDRRGECLYAACQHYRKCFIERAVRKTRYARIVVANHALVMHQAALDAHLSDGGDPATADRLHSSVSGQTADPDSRRTRPVRFIFDEGHHLFDAADSAFSAHLTGLECAELRRWIRGPEGRQRRGRDLRARLDDLLGDIPGAEEAVGAVWRAAAGLPAAGWQERLAGGQPQGPAEWFFAGVRDQILARQTSRLDDSYDLETEPWPATDDVCAAADRFWHALDAIAAPLRVLADALHLRLGDIHKPVDGSTRNRLEALERSLRQRSALTLPAWRQMLRALHDGPQAELVDWFGMDRSEGRMIDVGMHRHWIDPTVPFCRTVLEEAQGALVTSATLKDERPADEQGEDGDWQSAELRTGAAHLPLPARRYSFPSPFDYPRQTRVFIITDVNREDARAVAAAYHALFLASGGGALGLFTSIARLRRTHEHIAAPLEQAGLPLYAQHVDAVDTGTLVDIFRLDDHACLLGTDALRDGIDVPGRALRLIVLDRVPWPRPDLLHKARRQHFGRKYYDDMLTRLRLKQAFGRLMRRADDRGVFVILDARTPTRLLSAFPAGTEVRRLGLNKAVAACRDFFAPPPPPSSAL